MRPIDADALAKFIDYGHLNNPNDKAYSENDIREMIDMMPTVDAVPVRHGKWILDGEFIDCSECRREKWSRVPYESLVKGFKYCPKCGARMDKE